MEGPESSSPKPSSTTASFGTRTIRFETGPLAQQAAGSAVAYLDDDTMLLSATTAGKHPKDQFDFFPLTVDVEERMYAAGRIPGSFFRREGRPSEDAILTCRLIDRPLRPLRQGPAQRGPGRHHGHGAQPRPPVRRRGDQRRVASTQLAGLPFSGPIGAVRVALIEGQWVAFPTVSSSRTPCSTWSSPAASSPGRRRRDHDGRGRGHREHLELVAGGPPPRPRRSWPGPRGVQAVHQARCARPSRAGRARPRSRPRVPGLPRLPGRRLRGGRPLRHRPSSRRAHDRRQAGARDRARPSSRSCSRTSSAASSRAARRRSAPRTAR
jgi:hypothetical protein